MSEIAQLLAAERRKWNTVCFMAAAAMLAFHAAGLIALNSRDFGFFSLITAVGSTGFFLWAWNRRGNAIERETSTLAGDAQHALGADRLSNPVRNARTVWPIGLVFVVPLFLIVLLATSKPADPLVAPSLRAATGEACADTQFRPTPNRSSSGVFQANGRLIAVHGAPESPRLISVPRATSDGYDSFREFVLTEDGAINSDRVLCFTSYVGLESGCREHAVELRVLDTQEVIVESGIEAMRRCGRGSTPEIAPEIPDRLTPELSQLLAVLYP